MFESEFFMRLIIICPLVFLAGLIDAISGGGGLISVPAYTFAGLPVHSAIATNKLSSSMGTAISTARYIKNGLVPWHFVPLCVAGAFGGSALGANLALLVSDYYFKLILLFVVPVTAFYILKNKKLTEDTEVIVSLKYLLIAFFISFGLGTYDGFYGPGTGTFLIVLLSVSTHMKLTNANGLTKVINLTTNVASLVVYLLNAKVLIPLGLIAGVFNIAGNFIGSHLFLKNSSKYTKPFLLTILSIFYIKLLHELFM